MTGRLKGGGAIALGGMVLLSASSLLWLNRPFQAELGSYRTSLVDRTQSQLHNIRQAVIFLDGVVIESGQTFSFNDNVGPRTPDRGFRAAPAFLERNLVTSIGGGICQLSSTLYNAALYSGLEIVERHPHSRLVASIPPGRDATVWYGVSDLRVKNINATPIRVNCDIYDGVLSVCFSGDFPSFRKNVEVMTNLVGSSGEFVQIETVRIVYFHGGRDLHFRLSMDKYLK